MSEKYEHSPGDENPVETGQTGESSQLPVESGAVEVNEAEANKPIGQSTEAPAEG